MKIIVVIIIFLLVVGFTGFAYNQSLKTTTSNNKTDEKSKEELYQDVFITLLTPYIQEAVNEYYGMVKGENPGVDPYFVKVLNVVRPDGYRTYNFIIKFKVTPYIGAHNMVGLDHVTVEIELGKVKVIKFEHIEGYNP